MGRFVARLAEPDYLQRLVVVRVVPLNVTGGAAWCGAPRPSEQTPIAHGIANSNPRRPALRLARMVVGRRPCNSQFPSLGLPVFASSLDPARVHCALPVVLAVAVYVVSPVRSYFCAPARLADSASLVELGGRLVGLAFIAQHQNGTSESSMSSKEWPRATGAGAWRGAGRGACAGAWRCCG